MTIFAHAMHLLPSMATYFFMDILDMLPHQPTFSLSSSASPHQPTPSLPPSPTFLPPAGPLLTWFGLSSYGHLLFHVHVPLRHTSPQLSQDARKPGLAVVAFHGLLGESLQRPLGWHTL